MSLCAPFAECAIGLTAPIGTSNEALVTTSLNAPAQLVPGIQQLNAGHAAEVDSVSCWSFGNCLAGGFYTDADHHAHPFIAADINSTWGQGTEVPGLTNTAPVATAASALSVSCPAAGDCSAGRLCLTTTSTNRRSSAAGQRHVACPAADSRRSQPQHRWAGTCDRRLVRRARRLSA